MALIDQIRTALDESRFPLFVSEGDSDGKLQRIRHSGYLHRALRSFRGNCDSKAASIFLFGHSLADNDAHVLLQIQKGKCAEFVRKSLRRPYVSRKSTGHSSGRATLGIAGSEVSAICSFLRCRFSARVDLGPIVTIGRDKLAVWARKVVERPCRWGDTVTGMSQLPREPRSDRDETTCSTRTAFCGQQGTYTHGSPQRKAQR